MNYGEIKKNDIADGPGVRVTIFVSGCLHHCKNCFNEMTWDFNYGKPFTKETENEVIEALKPAYITGLTLLGGEPFEPANQRGLINLLKRVREELPNKTIWGYSGFTFEELMGEQESRCRCEVTDEMLSLLDMLVDGRFEEDKKNLLLKFRGSSNQRIIDMKQSLAEKKAVISTEYVDRTIEKQS